MKPRYRRLLLGVLFWGVFFTACQPAAESPEPFAVNGTRPETAMKGMVLYSWQDRSGEWQFAILPGTNRQKTADEVLAAAVTLEEVKTAFKELAVGEVLFWNNTQTIATSERLTLATPPGEIVSTLRAHAAVADVQLILEE